MQFNDYKSLREKAWKGGTEEYLRWMLQQPLDAADECGSIHTMMAGLELSWATHDRPFYNVYPIAVELCLKTSLNMTWGDIQFPVRTLLLRFAHGHEPLSMTSALMRVPSNAGWSTPVSYHRDRMKAAAAASAIPLMANMQTIDDTGGCWVYASAKELRQEVIKDSLADSGQELIKAGASGSFADKGNFLIRLLAFIGLLAKGTDLITPAILSSDRTEYDSTSDESRKRWLECRAAKKLGPSFDVGRTLEIERAACPHWRSPHLALFHTGPGRSKPVLKVRSGCVVIPKDMSDVPTGYFGPETEQELRREDKPNQFRTALPKKVRFRVMRRDKYRCRLCGMTRDDGVTLQVDHIVPRAKGGTNDEKNLWTLCQPCNSGKSDQHLTCEAMKPVQAADGPAGKVRYERREVEKWMADPVAYSRRKK